MATQSSRGIRRDEFIKNVRPDPISSEALVILQGYIGDSDLDGHVRIYTDPTLNDFIDLPEREILYADPVETTEDSLGGSRIWVKKTTVFTAGDPGHVNRVKSSFLEGDIIKAFGNTGDIPTVVRTIGNREKISIPVVNCGTQISKCICAEPKTNQHPCSPPTVQAAGCPSFNAICPPNETKNVNNCLVGPVTNFTYPTVVTGPNVPLSAQGCTIGCTNLKDCTDLTICVQMSPPTFYNPTCKFHVTCPIIRCDAEFHVTNYHRAGTRVNTYCNCAFDHHHHAPTDTRPTHVCYEGGFNPYNTGY